MQSEQRVRLVPNPKPDLLVDFATACIWRMAAALSDGRPGRILGEAADLIEGRLFGPGDRGDPALFLEAFSLNDGKGEPLVVGLLPAPVTTDRKSWHFIVSGMRFLVDFDRGPDAAGVANCATELQLHDFGLREVEDVPGLLDAFLRMAAKRPSGRRA